MGKDSFFFCEGKEDGVYMEFVKKENDNVKLENLIYYLETKDIPFPNIPELKKLFDQAKEGQRVKLNDSEVIIPFNGWCHFDVQADAMAVYGVLYPPIKGMRDITLQEVLDKCERLKITYGIDTNAIEEMIREQKYFQSIPIVKGIEAVDGYDAVLKYNFNTDVKVKPQINDKGIVDYHNLNMINHISKGDVVAEITPYDPGKPGTTVYGNEVKPKKTFKKSFKYGRNLEVSEDGLKLISQVSGQVTLEADKIFVSNEYEAPADVDPSTGDIDFDGNVKVKGNVLAGFKIKATGNVIVDGVVEGAEIHAGGDIVLTRGIQGMGKGVVTAGGNITASFIEHSTARAKGNVVANAYIHSNVIASGKIVAEGKKGFIVGGNVRAALGIEARIIGSNMGITTVVGVGNDPEVVLRIEELKQKITQKNKEKTQLTQIVEMLCLKRKRSGELTSDQQENLQRAMKSSIMLEKEIADAAKELRQSTENIHEEADARIKVQNRIYTGTKIEIGDAVLYLRENFDFCQFKKSGMDISRDTL